ncbi:MAG: radical SAM protein [candidate division WOR-3 bacterium]
MHNFGFQWHITNFCNLRCFHCYQDEFTSRDDLKLSDIERIVNRISDTLRDWEIAINITGGEPLLYPDIFKVLGLLEDTANVKRINIITNGLVLNDDVIKKLNHMRKIKELKISLEGGDIETNNRIRGRGIFERLMHNIRSVQKDTNKEIVLMYTLGSYNYENLNEMLNLALNLSVNGVIIERFVPWGKGLFLKDQYLKKQEWCRVIEMIVQFAKLDYAPGELIPYKAFHIVLGEPIELKGALCNLGDESMALMPNGDVYPCRRFPTKIGNIIDDDFKEVLLRLKILKENIMENLKGRCANCKVEGCFGCRAIAYALTGDFYAEDPQCFL